MNDKNFEKYRNLGLSVSYFRKLRGLTQQNVADEINVSYETISRIENANTGISLDMLFELSRAIKTPLSELFKHAGL
ncbi:MAG: helix-turn-helix transcriptional regulator [Oscillospiraceae bacterium]|nr:helix-turn-helix transcriptional regulator [Oscillospiraceae bacterium]MBQ8869580.1 helix-turn-helix transcriptional regulator [Oscillospiraceae bacterium]